MKKNLITGILSIVSVLSISYGYYQKVRADENERIAIEQKHHAEEQMKLAEQQRRIAEMNAMEAMRQRQLVEAELQKKKGTN